MVAEARDSLGNWRKWECPLLEAATKYAVNTVTKKSSQCDNDL
jgi:hypothetical protein